MAGRTCAGGLIRAIGDPHERFAEDRLRMVRAVRLACGLDFAIDGPTLQAIRGHAAAVTQVAWERIGAEITRTLMEGGARRGIELLDETGLLDVILPEIAAMKGCEQTPDYHPEGDVFVHTLTLLQHLDGPSETLAYGCLLHDVAKPRCREPAGRAGDVLRAPGARRGDGHRHPPPPQAQPRDGREGRLAGAVPSAPHPGPRRCGSAP